MLPNRPLVLQSNHPHFASFKKRIHILLTNQTKYKYLSMCRTRVHFILCEFHFYQTLILFYHYHSGLCWCHKLLGQLNNVTGRSLIILQYPCFNLLVQLVSLFTTLVNWISNNSVLNMRIIDPKLAIQFLTMEF